MFHRKEPSLKRIELEARKRTIISASGDVLDQGLKDGNSRRISQASNLNATIQRATSLWELHRRCSTAFQSLFNGRMGDLLQPDAPAMDLAMEHLGYTLIRMRDAPLPLVPSTVRAVKRHISSLTSAYRGA